MAVRKVTFSLPEDLAERFNRRFPARERSRRVADALERELASYDLELVRACQIANADPDGQQIEQEFDAIPDLDMEPWNGPQAR